MGGHDLRHLHHCPVCSSVRGCDVEYLDVHMDYGYLDAGNGTKRDKP